MALLLSNAAENLNLFPDEYMGARPIKSIVYAVELLTKEIKEI